MNDSAISRKRRFTAAMQTFKLQLLVSVVCLVLATVALIAGPVIAVILVLLAAAVLVSPTLRDRLRDAANRKQEPDRPNWRRFLHVADDAPFEVVRAAYKALAFVHHPDRDPKGAEKMAVINAAWDLAQREYRGTPS